MVRRAKPVPYVLAVLGYLTAAGSLWWAPEDFPRIVQVSTSLLAMPAFISYLQHRATAPELAHVLGRDPRSPVLYLRAFHEESDAFMWGPKDEMQRYTELPFTAQTWPSVCVTAEQYLAGAVEHRIGPLVALGNPVDTLAPEGAARSYPGDDDWQAHFFALARESAAFLMSASRSANVLDEARWIRRNGWQERLFLLTEPTPKANTILRRWVAALVRRTKGIRRVSWTDFIDELDRLGYREVPRRPEPGSMIGFDSVGRAVLCGRRAVEPDEFVAPMVAHLASVR